MSANLIKRLTAAGLISMTTAGLSLLTTVLTVRWLGLVVYADYTVDLALISIVLVLMELVPSAFAVFKVQDSPEFLEGQAAFSIACIPLLAAVIWLLHEYTTLLQAFTAWIVLYCALQPVKRYLDIRLQSSGRLREYYAMELYSVVFRLALLAGAVWVGWDSSGALWMSLALGLLLAQSWWLVRNPHECRMARHAFKAGAWRQVAGHGKAYVAYYVNVGLKRIRDNAVPLLAARFFATKEATGIFFLAYRGLVFIVGQLRVIEGFLNHRATLRFIGEKQGRNVAIVTAVAPLACVAVSYVLAQVTGSGAPQWDSIVILSMAACAYPFALILRARALAAYRMGVVTAGMSAYVLTAGLLVAACQSASLASTAVFSSIIVLAEMMSLLVMWLAYKKAPGTL